MKKLAALLTLSFTAVLCTAQAVQDIYSPIIFAHEMYTTNPRDMQMHEDGTGLAPIARNGDLSHGGVKGSRYLLVSEAGSAAALPDGSTYVDLVVYNENGDPATRRVLSSDPSGTSRFARSGPGWSPDGQHAFYSGKQFDSAGTLVIAGFCVADVLWTGTSPSGLANERCVIATDHPGEFRSSAPAWNYNLTLVTYSTEQVITNPDGTQQRIDRIYLTYLPPTGSSDQPWDRKLNFTDGDRNIQIYPAFSPVAGDNRIAFSRFENNAQNNIWTVAVSSTYTGASLTPTQVTNKNSAPVNHIGQIAWSPDARYWAFTAEPPGGGFQQIYKIETSGLRKATALTKYSNKNPIAYAAPRWRR